MISLSPVRILTSTLQSVEPLQGLGRGLLGRIEKGQEPQQGHVGFVLHPIVRLVVIARA